MRKSLFFALLLFCVPTKAQWVVYDPTLHATTIQEHLVEVGKMMAMIENQIRQIQLMKDEIEQMTDYMDRFGDPKEITKILGADWLISSLADHGVGVSLEDMRDAVVGDQAFFEDGGGIYKSIEDGFWTSSGQRVQRDPSAYKGVEMIQMAGRNFDVTYANIKDRRQGIRSQMAETIAQLQADPTHVEGQKLLGVLIGQSAQLDAVDQEATFAVDQVLIQHVQNQADEQRQKRARLEEQAGEMSEGVHRLFRFMSPTPTEGKAP